MIINRYQYAVEFYKDNSTPIGRTPLSVDWEPALEWAWLCGLRQNRLHCTDSTDGSVIHPIWDDVNGEPYVSGFQVLVLSEEAEGISTDFTTAYFKDSARAATAALMDKGQAKTGEHLQYRVMAFANVDHASALKKPRFKTETVVPLLPLRQSMLSDFTGMSRAIHPTTPGDMPVLIRASVLDETVELSSGAGSIECGGILIGYLHRDPEVPEVFVEITTQVLAKHTVADTHKLTFTHDTWTAAQAAIDLRGRDELLLGWWHSHPVHEWCKDCPPEKRKVCTVPSGFLSIDDCRMHRTVFPRAYTLALLISHISDNNLPYSLFGWRNGYLEHRGFHVINAVNDDKNKNS